ncbi:MAG TPA: hypothetical protein VNZ67_11770 [bacterium]|jgi:hypothetical protein|nr:hypothetical protein [bacterium]
MKITKLFYVALVGACLAGLTIACDKGPAQKAGEKIDNAVQDTKDAVRDTAHDVKHDVTRN